MIEKKKTGSTATATTAANKKATVIMDDTDAQGMDLVLNAEFDSALLDCWEETTAAAGTTKDVVMLKTSNDDSSSSPSNDHSGRAWDAAAAAVDTVAANHRLSALPSFIIEDEVGVVDVKVDAATFPTTATTQQQQPPETTGTLKQDYKGGNIQEQHAVSAAASVASTKDGKAATSTTSSTTTMGIAPGTTDHCHQHQHRQQHQPQQQQQQQQRATLSPQPFTMDPNAPQLHPLAIQSSARCPPHAGLTAAQAPAASDHFAMQQNSSSSNNNNNSSLLPLAYNAMAAGLSFPSPFLFQAPAPYQPIGAAGAAAAMEPVSATGNSRMSPHVASASSTPTPPPAPVLAPTGASEDSSKAAPAESTSATGQANNSTNQQRPQNSNSPPPFLLFDAPLELRANFMQSQRAHGLPVMQDNNSYHYGMAVNGFHPQQNLGGGNIAGATTAADGNKQGHAPNVKLVDARHGDQGVKRIKNAKEQKRAQRITELIEELRLKMENGGWKVAMKSKFHTLSSCADYVKHLVKITKEKEDAVKKAKCDLEAKRQKIEDEKAQQDPSDPESTTSSLTVSSDSATAAGTNAAQMTGASTSSSGKEKDSSAGEDTGPPSKRTASGDPEDEDSKDPRKKKLRMLASHGSTVSASSTGDESAGDKARGPEGVQSLSIDQTVSTVSDITDSNKGSTTANSNSASAGSEEGTTTPPPSSRSSTRKRRHSNDHNSNNNGKDDNKKRSASSSDSVSSDAAVASRGREDDSKQQEAKHFADVIIQGRKRKPHSSLETTSLNENFQLDYQEVFLSSNVPQLLATTSGRIIAWNDFFLKATGLSRNEVERLTIFSLVNPSKLSNLFEIVAAALRMGAEKPSLGSSKETKETGPETKEEEKDEKGEKKDEKKKESGVDSGKKWDYAAMTLPCANFRTQRQHQGKKIPNLLYITVTLMADSDPHKRCFHCVFTDNPGTNGALGSITPDLLALLFAEPEDDEGAARPGAKKQPPK